MVKPFIKWAGGKKQLINDIKNSLPIDFLENNIDTYIEPFVGGGSVFLHILSNYNIKNVIINDLNNDLINTYNVIKYDCVELMKKLEVINSSFNILDDLDERSVMFNFIKELFNIKDDYNNLNKAIEFIFLNKTCFNGIFRVNSKGGFNVPFAKIDKVVLYDEQNLLKLSKKFQNVKFINGDYKDTLKYVSNNTFFYFDPPYRPLTKTASFNSYMHDTFTDDSQIELANMCRYLHNNNVKFLLSNSDPKNIDENDTFFDDLYNEFYIERIKARRMINSNGKNRGYITELLVRNYKETVKNTMSDIFDDVL